MGSDYQNFEYVVRNSTVICPVRKDDADDSHPFDQRNIHPKVAGVAINLFDDGHYPQSTFEACKLLEKEVGRISKIDKKGRKLMMEAFSGENPVIKIACPKGVRLSKTSEESIQEGYKFLFAGVMSGIRNARGHESGLVGDIDETLDHLSLISTLIRVLDSSSKENST